MKQQLLSILKVVGVILLGSFFLGGLLCFGARYIRYDEGTSKFKIGDNTEINGTLSVNGKISGDGSGLTGVNAAKLNNQSMSGPHGAGYYHIGAWGVGRTDQNAVLVNTAYRADIANNANNADMVDGKHAADIGGCRFCESCGGSFPVFGGQRINQGHWGSWAALGPGCSGGWRASWEQICLCCKQ
jgi:hypothetical protein